MVMSNRLFKTVVDPYLKTISKAIGEEVVLKTSIYGSSGVETPREYYNVGDVDISRDLFFKINTVETQRNAVRFFLRQLPGCCGVAIVHSGYSYYYRLTPEIKEVFSKAAISLAEELAKEGRYSILICSDIPRGFFYPVVSKDSSWSSLVSKISKKTNNEITLFSKNI